MQVGNKHYRTIWLKNDSTIQIIDQRHLPHDFVIEDLTTVKEVATAIKDMHVRGAGLIGATAGFGMYIATLQCSKKNFDDDLKRFAEELIATRPTASNLRWAIERQLENIKKKNSLKDKREIAKKTALMEW